MQLSQLTTMDNTFWASGDPDEILGHVEEASGTDSGTDTESSGTESEEVPRKRQKIIKK